MRNDISRNEDGSHFCCNVQQRPQVSLWLLWSKLMDFVCERTRLSLSCIACIYSISKPQWHFKGITGRQPKHRASLFLVAVLAYLLSSFYSCPRADGSVTSDSSQSFTQVLERDIGCIRTAASILGRSFAEEDGYPFHSTRICSVNQF